ncbi:riboflavin biosynthesis protein RibD, partial [Schnuerera sp. xch1]|uniref:deaminase n=1 Tax=Schnuerera sp. xch1 TaxID=2874283 RepID=UPI0021D8AEBC
MNDEHFMRQALDLAQKGMGFTSPNPLVGAVIVKDGIVIARGYHERYGESHAEANAINSADQD